MQGPTKVRSGAEPGASKSRSTVNELVVWGHSGDVVNVQRHFADAIEWIRCSRDSHKTFKTAAAKERSRAIACKMRKKAS